MSPIWDIVSGLVKPVTDLIGKAVLDKDLALQVEAAMAQMQYGFAGKLLDYETQLLDVQAKSVVAEESGASWLQRNWRPITMLTFLVLIVLDSFKLLKEPLAPQMWTLLQIGMGGYIAGRSLEKITPGVVNAIKASKPSP